MTHPSPAYQPDAESERRDETGALGSVLTEAEGLIYGERQAQYGTATDNFGDTAELWSATLGVPVSPYQVLLCLIQLKVGRALCDLRAGNPPKRDTVVDIAGYAGLIEKLERGL